MLFGVATVEDSGSFFSNLEKSLHNKFSSASWAVTEYELGDIIINEVHWPSSPAGDDDQWIELFNTTDEDISLTGWILENASNPPTLNIVGNPTIEAGGFLIITKRNPNSSQSALAVSTDVQNASIYFNRAGYEQITLKDPSGEIIDQTPEREGELVEWPEGEYVGGEKYFSMQRKDNTKKDGTTPDSWYTCDPDEFSEDELITMKSYWKEEYQTIVCGTPKHPNLPTNIASPQTAGFLSIDKNKPSDVQGEIKGLSDDEKDSVKDIAIPPETETTEEPTDEMRIEEEEEEDAEEKEAHQPTEQKEESEETVKKENRTENDDERDDDNEEEFSSKEDEDNTYRAENDDLDEMVKENDIDQKVADKDVDMSDESDNPEKPETSESYE